jgi:hypothetical protein
VQWCQSATLATTRMVRAMTMTPASALIVGHSTSVVIAPYLCISPNPRTIESRFRTPAELGQLQLQHMGSLAAAVVERRKGMSRKRHLLHSEFPFNWQNRTRRMVEQTFL